MYELRILQNLKKIRGFVKSTRTTNRRISTLCSVVPKNCTLSCSVCLFFCCRPHTRPRVSEKQNKKGSPNWQFRFSRMDSGSSQAHKTHSFKRPKMVFLGVRIHGNTWKCDIWYLREYQIADLVAYEIIQWFFRFSRIATNFSMLSFLASYMQNETFVKYGHFDLVIFSNKPEIHHSH